MRIINNLMKMKEAFLFLEPVDAEKYQVSDYFDIIKRPMDFGTVRENLKKHTYLSIKQFLADIEQVFENCYLYNGEASHVSQMCKKV